MDNKKDIGIAIKDKLVDFRESPDKKIWLSIEAELNKKRKRRLLFIWLIGIAMLAIIPVLYLNKYSFSETNHDKEQRLKNIIYEQNNDLSNVPMDKDPAGNEKNINLVKKNSLTNFREPSSLSKNKSYLNEKPRTNYSTLGGIEGEKETSKKERKPERKSDDNIEVVNQILLKQDNQSELSYIKDENTENQHNSLENDSILIDKPKNEIKVAQTQENKKTDSIPQENDSKWSITPQIITSYYGALQAKSSNSFSNNYGLLLSYQATNKTFVRIGVKKLNLNQKVNELEIETSYLEIPLEFKYAPFNKNLNPYLSSGISYFILQDIEISDEFDYEFNSTFGLNLALGLEYKIVNKIYLNAESTINYKIKPIIKNNDLSPFIINFSLGLEYRF